MMLAQLQQHLFDTKRYAGAIDGKWGRLTEGGILLALTDGPDTALGELDFRTAGELLDVQPAAIKAFWKTEANGAGFQNGRPKILPEPHRFSRATAHAFDRIAPDISYAAWGTKPYPSSMDARYDELLAWGKLLVGANMPIDAMFASASYGAPQIMGENFAACGYPSAFAFAEAMARDEKTQLDAFSAFVKSAGILPYLRQVSALQTTWAPVAQRYNGTAYRQNNYDGKMVTAFISFGGK